MEEKDRVKKRPETKRNEMSMYVILSDHLGHLLRKSKVVKINSRLEIIGSYKDIEKVVEYLKVLFDVKLSI